MRHLTVWDWCGIIAVMMIVTAGTWSALNIGRMLYDDWAFLHTIRVNTEQQQRQAPQSPPPQPAPPGGR